MTSSILRARFGRGAARIAIGLPPDAPALSALARTRGAFDQSIRTAPVVFVALLFALLSTSSIEFTPSPESPDRAEDSTRIVLLEPTPTPIDPTRVTPTPEPHIVEHVADAPAPTPSDLAPPHDTVDPRSLVVATRPDVPEQEPQEIGRTPTPRRRPTVSSVASIEPDVLAIASALRTVTSRARASTHDALAVPRPGSAARPSGERAGDVEHVRIAASTSTPGPPEIPQAIGTRRAGGTEDARLPAVSLGAASSQRAKQSIAAWTHDALEHGWQEVPLDDLPDCDPPGRQDRLKQQIMLAADRAPTCRSTWGEYRFLETRNLNAFLMWARSTPNDASGGARLRDACDVLTRALDCLEQTPATKELRTR